MGKGGSAPKAPDPQRTAQAQLEASVAAAQEQARLNRINEYTPYGSVTYRPIVDPAEQQRYDAEMAAYQKALAAGGVPRASPGGSGGGSVFGIPWSQIGGAVNKYGTSDGSVAGLRAPAPIDPNKITYERVTQFSPEMQRAYEQERQLDEMMNALGLKAGGYAQQVIGTPFSPTGLPDLRWDINAPLASNLPALRWDVNAPEVQGSFGASGPIQTSLGPTDYEASRKSVEQALLSRVQPQFDRDRANAEARLAAMGVMRGGDAWNREMDTLNRSMTDARMQAVLAGGQEQSRLFNMALQSGVFANQAQAQDFSQKLQRGQFANAAQAQQYLQEVQRRNLEMQARGQGYAEQGQMWGQEMAQRQLEAALRSQGFQEQAYQRALPLQEIAALFGLGGQSVMPNAGGVPQVGVNAADIAGLYNQQYQGQLFNWQNQQANSRSALNALMQLGMMFGGSLFGGPAGAAAGYSAASGMGGWF
jgi:hypothetical protein